VLPAAAFFAFVVLWPSLQGVGLSLTSWNGLSPDRAFVGLQNFLTLLKDPDAGAAVVHTLLIAATVTIIQNVIGLLLALALNSRITSRNVLRVLLFAPAIITPVATGYLWQYMLAPTGALNDLLGFLGFGALQQPWLGNGDTALWAICLVIVWQFSGYSMVIFLANLQSVPTEVLEAASLDGAGPARRFWSVIRPELAPSITINVMLALIGGLKTFDQVYVMTGGGPGGATETMSTFLYKNAFQFGTFSYGLAIAVVLTIIVAVLATGQNALLRSQNGV
jgi:raffinose/stachyose/melibiose transport system permease protein